MPELTIDFSEEQSFEPIPNGRYVVKCVSAQPGESQAGNAKIDLQFEIIEGEHTGRRLFDSPVLEGKGTWKIRQVCDALFGGVEGENVGLESEDFIDGVLEVKVTQKVWKEEDGGDGEVRNRISRYYAVAALAPDDLAGMFTPESGEPDRPTPALDNSYASEEPTF